MMMIRRGFSGAFSILRRITGRLQGRAVILLYHRVAELKPDPQLLCASPANFAEHLEIITRHYRPVSLRALEQALHKKDVPRKTVVVTFDDGYADNFSHARPLLERYDIPATFFITSGYVGQDREFSSDVLERCLLATKPLPESLTLLINGRPRAWQVGNTGTMPDDWNVTLGYYPTPRHKCYHDLHQLLQPMSAAERQRVLNDLSAWAGCPIEARPEYRPIAVAELKDLAGDRLIEVGAHTVNHLQLAAQPMAVQQREISESQQQLEEITGVPVTSFSYPYGGIGDMTETTVGMVRESGFSLACANRPGPVTRRSDLFQLPRVLVRNWGGEEFSRRLRGAFID